jgi:hypothetical protein
MYDSYYQQFRKQQIYFSHKTEEARISENESILGSKQKSKITHK